MRHLDAVHDRFTLRAPFRISRGVRTATDVVTVTLRDGDLVGRGEGVPYPRYGESVEQTLAAIAGIRGPLEAGAERAELLDLLPPGAARNAVDCALWDLEARRTVRSVAALIGAPEPQPLASALTIGIDTPEAMAREAATHATAPVLKIKVDRDDPAARIRAVRREAPEAQMIVDPNESWDRATLDALRDMLVETRVALLEQPVPAGEDDWLEGYDCPVPIAADEAAHVAGDVDRLAALYDVVNIKLDKTGGLTAALELAGAVRSRGMGLMTGCMVCSSLSIAAALHIARTSDFVDLDGPLWLAEDRPGGVSDAGGILSPPRAGFWGTV